MPRIAERYENHDWRLEPQERFWKTLERAAPDIWEELDNLARRWAEVAPGAELTGLKIGSYKDRENPQVFGETWRKVGEKHGMEVHYIDGGGTLSAEMSEALRAWQHKYGLEAAWLTRKAELYVLQKHTHISLSYITGYASVGPHPAPQPDDVSDGQVNKAWVREVYNPHWNISHVQPTPTFRHLEWFIHYQCYRCSCRDISVKYKVSEQPVERAIKRVSDIIALPLRLRPKGRPKKIPTQ